MTEADARREKINLRIAASQERMRRDSANLPAVPVRESLPDAYPPEDYRTLAGEYPWLTMAAGAGLGLLAGALLPKKSGARLGKRALGMATIAAELGLALSRRAGEAADEKAAPLRQRAGRAAGSARAGARSAGATIAREAIRLAARARR